MIIVKQVSPIMKRSLETLSLFTSLTRVSTKPKRATECFVQENEKVNVLRDHSNL